MMEKIKEKITSHLNFVKSEIYKAIEELQLGMMKQHFFMLLVIYIVATFSIIRADFAAADDLERSLNGCRGWAWLSRYVTEYGSILIHDGKLVTDISPFPQLLALGIMALAGVIVLKCFIKNRDIKWYDVVCVSPMALSPYFLSAFVFKFDAPYIALSILGSVIPFLFWNYKNLVFSFVSFISLLVMCNTYQAASGIYLMMGIFLSLHDYLNRKNVKECFKKVFIFLAVYSVALLFYKLFIVVPVDSYVSSNFVTSFGDIAKNIRTYFRCIRHDIPKRWLLYIVFIGSMVVVNSIRKGKEKLRSGLLVMTLIPIMAVLSLGAYIVLSKPLFDSRALFGSFVFTSIMTAFIIGNNVEAKLCKIVGVCLAWSCFVYALTYGNVLMQEKKYEEFRAQITLCELNKVLPRHHNKIQIQFIGYVQSPFLVKCSRKYPVLKRGLTVPSWFGDSSWYFSVHYMLYYIGMPNLCNVNPRTEDFRKLNLPILVETDYHIIRANNEKVLVEVR